MFERFERVTATDPYRIQSAMWATLLPAERGLANYRGTTSRRYEPADRRSFQFDRSCYRSTFAVSYLGSLRIAANADQRGVTCITEPPGLDAYCLSLIRHGSASLTSSAIANPKCANESTALICAGWAGTKFTSSDSDARLTVWIPAYELCNCLAELIERPLTDGIWFEPTIDLIARPGASLVTACMGPFIVKRFL